jgi:hypothetical protein
VDGPVVTSFIVYRSDWSRPGRNVPSRPVRSYQASRLSDAPPGAEFEPLVAEGRGLGNACPLWIRFRLYSSETKEHRSFRAVI